jgi:hypothetical protein
MTQVPIADGLLTLAPGSSAPPRMLASRCPRCAALAFPVQSGDRQVPGTPRVGNAQLYGAPGTAGVTITST